MTRKHTTQFHPGNSQLARENPNRILTGSPGLRGTSYPGLHAPVILINRNAVVAIWFDAPLCRITMPHMPAELKAAPGRVRSRIPGWLKVILLSVVCLVPITIGLVLHVGRPVNEPNEVRSADGSVIRL